MPCFNPPWWVRLSNILAYQHRVRVAVPHCDGEGGQPQVLMLVVGILGGVNKQTSQIMALAKYPIDQ